MKKNITYKYKKNKINNKKFKKNNTNITLDQETPIPSYYNNSKIELELKKSIIDCAGFGVFALEFIPCQTLIANYEGKKTRVNKTGEYYIEINHKIGIDAITYPRCYMAMINDVHKTTNKINCKFLIDENKKIVEIWSIHNIDIGDELFISYGNDYWSDN